MGEIRPAADVAAEITGCAKGWFVGQDGFGAVLYRSEPYCQAHHGPWPCPHLAAATRVIEDDRR